MNDFYAAAVCILWEGWDSMENTEKYIANAEKQKRTLSELHFEIQECMEITPIPDFSPVIDGASEIYSYRDDWNRKEFVWSSQGRYWLMEWGTSA